LTLRWLLWSLASPSQILVACAIAGGLLLLLARPRIGPPGRVARLGRALAVTGGLGLLVFGLLPTSHALARVLEERFPRPDLPPDVAGIVLLGGAERLAASEAHGEPLLNAFGTRYVAALRLAARYPQARLVHTGGARLPDGTRRLGTESGVAAAVLEGSGLDRRRIVYESIARDSCEHPARVRDLVRPAPGETWVVVTSAMHMPRAMGCFRAAGWPGIVPYPTDYRVVAGDWDRGSFRVTDNLALLDAALHEWIGLAYYRLTGRIAEIFPAP
jgi:uncharacterized SAM-binding protein YcdF (DUF218 family)